jgi:chromosome partitioning protein
VAIIAVSNQKGGVGKTATAANLGAALAAAGRRVLLVDLDAQANLTLSCGVTVRPGQATAYELLMDKDVGLEEVALGTPWAGLDVVPATEALAAAQVQLANAKGRNERLRGKLEGKGGGTADDGQRRRGSRASELRSDALAHTRDSGAGGAQVPALQDGAADGERRLKPAATKATGAEGAGYEFVVMDTPPSLGFLTLNALTAADWVLIPVQASFLALHGLRQLMQTVEGVQGHSNAALRVGGVLVTMYDGRTLHAQQVVERLRDHFGEVLFEVAIRRSVAFDYATVAGVPLVYHQPGHGCAGQYRQLAQEVMQRA